MSASIEQKTTLPSVMKDISEALVLDRNDKNEDAYRKYLQCVLRITTKLLRNLHSEDGHLKTSPEVCKFVKLGQQCMDRVASIVSETNATANTARSRDMSLRFRPDPVLPGHTGFTPTTPSGEVTSPHSLGVTSPGTPGDRVVPKPAHLSSHETPSGPVTSEDMSASQKRHKKLTPVEMAVWQNQQLLSAFKARQAQALKGGKMSVNTNLSLTLQRKMAENMAIAKAQEDALAKKMKERHQRLEEQAARRFHAPLGLSEEEHEQRLIYKHVLEFEQEEIWMIDWRRRLEENPTDADIISQLIEQILSCESHPLTQQLKAYQTTTLSRVYHLVENKIDKVNLVAVPLPKHLLSTLAEFRPPDNQFSEETSNKNQSASSPTDGTGKSKQLASLSCDSSAEDESISRVDCESNINIADTEDKICNVSSQNKTCDVDNIDGESKTDQSSIELQTDIKPEPTSSSLEVNDNVDDDEHTSPTNNTLAGVTSAIETDLKEAIAKSKILREKLLNENKASSNVIRQSTEEYELYNQENMDDLFDDDSNDESDATSIPLFDSLELASSKSNDQLNTTDSKADLTEKVVPDSDTSTKPRSNSAPSRSSSLEETQTGPKTPPTCTISKGLHKTHSFGNIDKKINNLKNEAYHRHLEAITEDIVTFIERVQVLFVIAFEQLDSPVARDQSNVLLEAYFFKPLWQYLMVLFRLANEPKEIAIAQTMTRQQEDTPLDFGVREKLCLTPASDDLTYAYEPAVTEFLRFVDCYTMLEKLDCLVKTSRMVLHCVETYYRQPDRQREHKPSIGADDLLPVLCYVVSKSRLPQVVSECHAIERFIHEGYMFGEEGYCLTSFQTAVNYLISQGMKPELA